MCWFEIPPRQDADAAGRAGSPGQLGAMGAGDRGDNREPQPDPARDAAVDPVLGSAPERLG